ncbi:MAG: OFA family MFS transporter [Oscillospiraceae bacterium]|nr:OFA family MFS transporter [Oscillospiraceae bacterium]
MNDTNTQKKARVILIAGIIYMVSIGMLYAWSVIRRVIEAEWEWTATQSGLPFSLVLICFATGNLIGGRLQMKIPARIVGTIGAVLTGTGLLLSGFIGNNPTMVAVFFGVVTGFGIGFGYSSYLPTVLKWYHPSKKGFVSGWIIGGFGLTALYLAPLASYLIDRFGLQTAFVILGIKTLAISIPLAQLIKSPPEGYVPPEPKNFKQKAAATLRNVTFVTSDKTWTQMIGTGEFYILFFMFLCSVSIGQMVIGNITGIAGLQVGIDDPGMLAGLVAFMALVNCAGRIIGGIISDKIGWANTLLIVFALHCLNMLGFGYYTSLPLLITGITFAGLCFGATLSVYPAITVDRFGLKNYSANYGIMYMAFGFAGIAAPLIASFFLDKSGNYNTVYIICAIGMVVMIFANLLIRKIISTHK